MIATASSLAGTYTCKASCDECENTLTKLKLTPDANSDGGTFTLTKMNCYDDASRRIMYRGTGEWYILPNKSSAQGDNTTIIVVDIDDFQNPEEFALFLLKKDGSLQELNRKNPEKMPLYSFRDTTDHEVYIARKGAHPLPLNRTLYDKYDARVFLNAAFEHIYKKQ